ncbi:hypothetical protein Tco_1236723 [Tanacetum coccineum]
MNLHLHGLKPAGFYLHGHLICLGFRFGTDLVGITAQKAFGCLLFIEVDKQEETGIANDDYPEDDLWSIFWMIAPGGMYIEMLMMKHFLLDGSMNTEQIVVDKDCTCVVASKTLVEITSPALYQLETSPDLKLTRVVTSSGFTASALEHGAFENIIICTLPVFQQCYDYVFQHTPVLLREFSEQNFDEICNTSLVFWDYYLG